MTIAHLHKISTENKLNCLVNKINRGSELRIMTSQIELPTLKFYLFKFYELVTRCETNVHIVLELVTREF